MFIFVTGSYTETYNCIDYRQLWVTHMETLLTWLICRQAARQLWQLSVDYKWHTGKERAGLVVMKSGS